MEAIILAGGKGTRLQPKVSHVPKPMAKVQAHPFLEHLMSYWLGQGVSHFILSVGHLHEKVTSHFGKAFRGVPVSYSVETEPLGTGGGALLAANCLRKKETAILLNGDSFLEIQLPAMLQFHQEKRSVFTLALARVEKNTRYGGIELDDEDRCISLGSASPLINGGVYLFEPGFLSSKEAGIKPRMISLEKEMIPGWIEQNKRIYGWSGQGRFIDIGTPEDYARAESFFK